MQANETMNKLVPRTSAGRLDKVTEFTDVDRASLLRSLKLDPGSRVLDITSEPVSNPEETMIWGNDTATDLDIEQSEAGGSNEIVNLDFTYTSAAELSLPFENERFDAVISAFGVMFGARPDRIVSEIHRVCKPGGSIALASWTPDSVIGQMFRLASRYAPWIGSWPFQWGRSAWVRKCFGAALTDVEFSRQAVMMSFPFTVPAVVDFWLTYCRPLSAQLGFLDPDQQADLRLDLEWLISNHNLAADQGSTLLEAEYLQTKAYRRREGSEPAGLFNSSPQKNRLLHGQQHSF